MSTGFSLSSLAFIILLVFVVAAQYDYSLLSVCDGLSLNNVPPLTSIQRDKIISSPYIGYVANTSKSLEVFVIGK